MNNGMTFFHFGVVDEMGAPVPMDRLSSLVVFDAGTLTESTIYSDQGQNNQITNPVTAFSQSRLGFWSANTSHDVLVIGADGSAKMNSVTPSDNYVILTEQASADFSALVSVNTADGAEHTDDAGTFTDFAPSVDIDGRRLQAGDVVRIRGCVRVDDVNSTNTLDLKLLFGTEAVFSTGDLSVTDDASPDWIAFEADIAIRAVGSSGKVAAVGSFDTKLNATHARESFRLGEASEDLSDVLTLKLQGDWSAEHAENVAVLETFQVEILRGRAAA